MRVVILDSGIANVASVASAFTALGAAPLVTRDAARAREATHLVLPGVGSFGAGMSALRSAGLDQVVLDAVARDTPLLAICLGLQLLTEGSDESPGVTGLGVIPARCVRLPDSVSVPHLGWNAVVGGRAVWSKADTRPTQTPMRCRRLLKDGPQRGHGMASPSPRPWSAAGSSAPSSIRS